MPYYDVEMTLRTFVLADDPAHAVAEAARLAEERGHEDFWVEAEAKHRPRSLS